MATPTQLSPRTQFNLLYNHIKNHIDGHRKCKSFSYEVGQSIEGVILTSELAQKLGKRLTNNKLGAGLVSVLKQAEQTAPGSYSVKSLELTLGTSLPTTHSLVIHRKKKPKTSSTSSSSTIPATSTTSTISKSREHEVSSSITETHTTSTCSPTLHPIIEYTKKRPDTTFFTFCSGTDYDGFVTSVEDLRACKNEFSKDFTGKLIVYMKNKIDGTIGMRLENSSLEAQTRATLGSMTMNGSRAELYAELTLMRK